MVRYRIRYAAALAVFIMISLILPPQPNRQYKEATETISYEGTVKDDSNRMPVKPACMGEVEQVRILLVIRSQISHRQQRDHVRRQVKERANCSVKALFVFGKFIGRSGDQLDRQLAAENTTTGDIVQVDVEYDFRLKGVVGAQVIQSWMRNLSSCVRYDEVVFGKYDAPYDAILKDNLKKYDTNWELDDCLKFAHQYRNSVQFTAAYFPPRDNATNVVWATNSSLDLTYSYKEQIVTPHYYRLLLGDSHTCQMKNHTKKLFAIIAVHTAPGNFINRNMIRKTWGTPEMLAEYRMKLIFFLGANDELSDEIKEQVKSESAEHGDMVQNDFKDSYKNMTLKQISIMKFLTKFCSKVDYSYVLKTDDDIVIDLKSVYNYFQLTIPANRIHPRRTIFCAHMNGPAIVPRYEDKWFVSREEYPANLYPSYCSGAGYLITKDLVRVFYQTSLHVKNFWVDDTFVSGIISKAAGDVSLIQLPKQHLIPLFTMRRKGLSHVRKMFVHVGQDMKQFKQYWLVLRARHSIRTPAQHDE